MASLKMCFETVIEYENQQENERIEKTIEQKRKR